MDTVTNAAPTGKRTMTFTPEVDDFGHGVGTLRINDRGAVTRFTVLEFPSRFHGRDFMLAKFDGNEMYSVFCSANGAAADSCDCAAAKFRKATCRHRLAIRKLVAAGRL
jgi:hypothetical protein